MADELRLQPGRDVFTFRQLLERACKHLGIPLIQGSSSVGPLAGPIVTYDLTKDAIKALAAAGIVRDQRPDGVVTFLDTGSQHPAPGFAPSNYWNFWRDRETQQYDFRMALRVKLWHDKPARGFYLFPQVWGTCLSAGDRLPNMRAFAALVSTDQFAPALAKRLAASEEPVNLTWSELGLGGIRRMDDLFHEFVGGKEEILNLGRRRQVFDPQPFDPHNLDRDKDLYVVERVQPKLFRAWERQLHEYSRRLTA